jgi:hypothetical protein
VDRLPHVHKRSTGLNFGTIAIIYHYYILKIGVFLLHNLLVLQSSGILDKLLGKKS